MKTLLELLRKDGRIYGEEKTRKESETECKSGKKEASKGKQTESKQKI